MTNRNSTLAPPTKRLKRSRLERKTRLRNRGGRMFKQTPDDKLYWDWFKWRRLACDACGYWPASAAHLMKRGSGGKDLHNLVWLCESHSEPDNYGRTWIQGCHPQQEGRTDAFVNEIGVDLYAIAAAHTAQWRKEKGRG